MKTIINNIVVTQKSKNTYELKILDSIIRPSIISEEVDWVVGKINHINLKNNLSLKR